ncbi:hypothetical protein AB6A40_000555 [Gnathostoma spinigerum]|uniref:Uncharacterized protein n=1 Tax=Gnathostoma spinigerum TaxID=75299 RepID=A0ABD6E4D4_9BILA
MRPSTAVALVALIFIVTTPTIRSDDIVSSSGHLEAKRGGALGTMRFDRRSALGTMRFGKRQTLGTMRFGKRFQSDGEPKDWDTNIAYLLSRETAKRVFDEQPPERNIRTSLGTMRFGKRDTNPLGTMRFGKREMWSDDGDHYAHIPTTFYPKRSNPLGTMRFGKRRSMSDEANVFDEFDDE